VLYPPNLEWDATTSEVNPMLIISRQTVEQMVSVEWVLEVVEAAFFEHGQLRVKMPPKLYLDLPEYDGDFRAMPAFVNGAAGLKWVNSHPKNPSRFGKPTVMAILIYNNPATGEPLAVMDATAITKFRTAAATAVATRYLADKDSKTLSIIGCGAQAGPHLVYLDHVMHFEHILLYDRDTSRAQQVARSIPGKCRVVASAREAARADVVTTITPGNERVLSRRDITGGCHINAIGADALGKQELDPGILLAARVFVDDMAQATHSGEVSTPIHEGIYKESMIAGTLGEVVTGKVKARYGKDDITLFDSTGLAIEDIAMAKHIYEQALAQGLGLKVDLI
jgi:ornithine cyclodeaminase/alanine dehydrogenase